MSFSIQAGAPKSIPVRSEEDESLWDAIESAFPLQGERAVLVWNHIPILLGYKYDIALMVEDLLLIIEELQSRCSGELTNHWISNTFAHEWRFRWNDHTLTIESKWGEIGNGLEELLRRSGPVTLDIEAFTAEWKKVLENVIEALRQAGYKEAESEEMNRLVKVWSRIRGEGILYSSNEQCAEWLAGVVNNTGNADALKFGLDVLPSFGDDFWAAFLIWGDKSDDAK